MKRLSAIVIGMFALTMPAAADWQRIGNGNEFQRAKAYCEMLATSADTGFYAWGSPAYVLGASIGNAIGNAIREQQFFQRCMIMQGWQNVRRKSATTTTWKNGDRSGWVYH